MTPEQRKDYIRQFVSQGIDPEQTYLALYMTDAEISAVESDLSFMAELRDSRMRVGLGFVQAYHTAVGQQGKPGDHATRVKLLYPELFKADGGDTRPLDLNLTIIKKRGAQ